jgi:hypothetical protein
MLTIAAIALVSTLTLLVAPAVLLQLFVSRCYGDGSKAVAAGSDASPLSQRWATLMDAEPAPSNR